MRFSAAAFALLAATPAAAQHAGHAGHGSAPAAEQPAAKPQPAAAKPKAEAGQDTHAGHETSPAASSQGAAAPAEADPHAGHNAEAAAAPVAAQTAAETPPPIPEDNAADGVYDRAAMERARQILRTEHGGGKFSMVLFDLAEVQANRHGENFLWDAQFWYGGDFHRLVIKSEGEGEFGGEVEHAEVQALWSRAIDPYFDFQAGVRYDVRPDPERAYAVIGVEGLAPYWFEVEAHAFLSNKGHVLARLKAEHDMRFTQRLILQPRAEVNLAAQTDRKLGIGSGFSDFEFGLRLRYEIVREFAPYVGVSHERLLGRTADFAREEGESRRSTSFVMGVRAWF